tara:strand:+ start:1477 stop:1878 length:402 start_codon:yes stop_codon:yes gene_type:complete
MDLICALKQNQNPNWKGKGTGDVCHNGLVIYDSSGNKQVFSWADLKRTDIRELAVIAWRAQIKEEDFNYAKVIPAEIKTAGMNPYEVAIGCNLNPHDDSYNPLRLLAENSDLNTTERQEIVKVYLSNSFGEEE